MSGHTKTRYSAEAVYGNSELFLFRDGFRTLLAEFYCTDAVKDVLRAVNSHEALVKTLTDARAAIASLPMDALGFASDPSGAQIHWPIRDELLHRIDTALSADAPVNGVVASSGDRS